MSRPATYDWPNDTKGDTIRSKTFSPVTVDTNPIDFTGVAICMQIRDTGSFLLKTLEIGSGITLVGTDGFTVEEFILDFEGTAQYDIEFTFPGNVVKTWIKGTIKIEKDITSK